MTIRLPALAAAALLAVTPVAALAYDGRGPAFWPSPSDAFVTGSVDGPRFAPYCPPNSAAEGNANQQNFPVKQYGQTAGGNRC